MRFCIVIPTYRRSELLNRVLPSYLGTGADEIILVDDGSGPPHEQRLATMAREHGVNLVTLPIHSGSPTARNEGILHSSGEWIVFGEDDVWFTPDYARTLIAHAVACDALMASGLVPLVDPRLLDGPREELDRTIRGSPMAGRPPDEFLGAPWPVERLPSGDIVTPLLTATAAVHRSVFDRVRYDTRYVGNSFREETDFAFSCAEAGFRTVYCPHAICGHMKSRASGAAGGQWSMSRHRYAFHMLTNNWRFLKRHEVTLRDARSRSGRSTGLVRMQLEFAATLLGRIRRPSA
jgi:GT2 family glycosyltransferase